MYKNPAEKARMERPPRNIMVFSGGENLACEGPTLPINACIEQKLPLVFLNKDFKPFVEHLGLVEF